MPVGGSKKMSKNKKIEVQQKLLEIKQRQQNWLKQRDQSQKDETKIKIQMDLNIPKDNAALTSKTVSKSGSKSSLNETKVEVNVREKFKHWVASRNEKEEVVDLNDSLSLCSGTESELERLVSPELDLGPPTQEQDFKNLAEKIANKVKEDMGISQLGSYSSKSTSAARFSSNSRTSSIKVQQERVKEKNNLVNHSCIVCQNMMLAPKHVPMMVIPCGHTLCKSCSERRDRCPSCGCQVSSLTVNIMLQQVIQEYHSTKVRLTLDRTNSDTTNSILSYNSAGEFYPSATSYKTQLASLQTRHEILSHEYETLLNKQMSIATKVQQQEKQLQNIQKQENEVEKTIKELQERLSLLKLHRNQYMMEVTEMQNEKYTVDKKMSLLKETLVSLERELDKVKLLSEAE